MLIHRNWVNMAHSEKSDLYFKKKVKFLLQQESQEALNRSPEFNSKLTYRYLLIAGHDPGDTWGATNFGTRGIICLNKLGNGPLCHATCQVSRL